MVKISNNETIDDLLIADLKVIQKSTGFRFSLDAVLLAHFVNLYSKDKVIDLGTGTGVIPLILSARVHDLDLMGIEIQFEMAEMCCRSMVLNNRENIRIIHGDFRKMNKTFHDKFDLVVSNPPYLPVNDGKISPIPQIAISRHEIKCNLAELVKTAAKLVRSKGRFAFIHRPERLSEIFSQLQKWNLEPRRMRLVHPQINKPANLVLIEAIKGAKPNLKVAEPLIVYNQDGTYTKELLECYFGGET